VTVVVTILGVPASAFVVSYSSTSTYTLISGL